MADVEVVLELDNPLDRKRIADSGQAVTSVFVNSDVPAAADLRVHIGQGAPGRRVGFLSDVQICPGTTDGVFVSTAVGAPGLRLSLILGVAG